MARYSWRDPTGGAYGCLNPMGRKSTGQYPPEWPEFARQLKDEAGWKCIRCGHPHDLPSGHVLTVHHATLAKDEPFEHWWAFLVLCQRCHLRIQGKVDLDRPWVWQHTPWFRPYAAGFYAFKYLGLTLTREETMNRIDELLLLEAQVVIGRDPVALG